MPILTLLGAMLTTHGKADGDEHSDHSFKETIEVRERTVFFDASTLPRMGSAFRRSLDDYAVLISGALARRVVTETAESTDLAHLIWIDSDLASTTSLKVGARELAKGLLRMSSSSSPVTVVHRRRDGRTVEQRLLASEAAATLFEVTTDDLGDEYSPTLEARVSAVNRLATEITRYGPHEIGALWLIADAWPLDTRALTEVTRPIAEQQQQSPSSISRTLQRSGRIAASYGWVVFAVAAQTSSPGRLAITPPQVHQGASQGFGGFVLFPRRSREARANSPESRARALQAATDIMLYPMRIFGTATSGSVAADEYAIETLIWRLRNRRRIVVQDEDSTNELRPLEVVWIGGDGRRLPTLPWVRNGSPPELATARLVRSVDEGGKSLGARLVEFESISNGDRRTRICFADGIRLDRLRVSWWDSAQRCETIGEVSRPSAPELPCAELPTMPRDGVIVLLEDVDGDRWGATRREELRRESASQR